MQDGRTDGWMNTTDYEDPYATHIDQKAWCFFLFYLKGTQIAGH